MGLPNEKRFEPSATFATVRMAMCDALFPDQVKGMDADQKQLYLAFELGVIEYYHRNHIMLDESNDFNQTFFEFIIYYTNKKYLNDASTVLDFWTALAVDGKMQKQRKLGYDSVADHTNPDGTQNKYYSPLAYFTKAIGLDC